LEHTSSPLTAISEGSELVRSRAILLLVMLLLLLLVTASSGSSYFLQAGSAQI